MENKLRHIDDLLKTSLGRLEATSVLDSDWLAVEKRLKHRRNRIFMVWFSLALVTLIGGAFIFTQWKQNPIVTNDPVDSQQTTAPDKSSPNKQETIPQIGTDQIAVEDSRKDSHSESLGPKTGMSTEVRKDRREQEPLDAQSTNDPVPSDEPDISAASRIKPVQRIAFNTLSAMPWEPVNWDYIPHHFEQDLKSFEYNNAFLKPTQKPGDPILGFRVSHMEAGLSVSPAYAGKFVSENSQLAGLIHRSYYDKVLNSEFSAPAYSISLNYQVHLRNSLFFGFGIGLTERTEFIDYNYIIEFSPVVNDQLNRIDGYAELVPPEEVKFQGSNSYHFIEIPFTLGYDLNVAPRMFLRSQIDLSYMLLTSQLGTKADYTYLRLYDLGNQPYYNTGSFSATFKSGIYLNFKKFVIGAEPVFSTNLNSITNNESALKIKPYSYGLNFTTNFKLYR